MLPCARRNEITLIARDGSKSLIHRCAHVDCERHGKDVDEAACQGCVMRVPSNHTAPCAVFGGKKDFAEPKLNPDGTLTYPKTGWEPPRVPYGFERSIEDAWTMIPKWPPCALRQMIGRKLSCGCVEFNSVCGSQESRKPGQLVVLSDCEACSVRKP